MKLNKSARELLDRYLLGVSRALAGKKREDIAAEIESSLLDRLDERYPDAQEITETQVKEVLQEMGSPRKLAASYSPQRSLIGPRLFPAYLMVLRIVVLAVVGALTLSIIIGILAGNAVGSTAPILEFLGTLWNGALMAAAFVTLTFAIIERVNEEKDIEELVDMEKFSEADLPDLNDTASQPSVTGTVFEIVMGVIGLAFFTYILNNDGQLPIIFNSASGVTQVQVFTDSFLQYVPVMMAITGLEITRNVLLLAQGRHSSLTNWWKTIMEGAHMVLTVLLLGSFPLITLDDFQSLPFTAGWDVERIESSVNLGLKIDLNPQPDRVRR